MPIARSLDKTVLNGVIVYIIHVIFVIPIVPYPVFPKTRLPIWFMNRSGISKTLCEQSFYDAPSLREIRVRFEHGPDAMHVVR